MMWVIANFIEENNIEVAPSCWVLGDECYWPTLPRDKLKKYIEKEVVQDGSDIWQKYKARIIGKPYDDLQRARMKSNLALVRSDIETEVETEKRKVKKNKRYNFSSASDSSDSSELEELGAGSCYVNDVTPRKRPPSKKKKIVVQSPLKEPSDIPPLRRSPRKPSTPARKAATPLRSIEKSVIDLSEQHRPSSSTGSTSKSLVKNGSSCENENFQQISIRNQNIIKTLLRSILGELSSLNTKMDILMTQRQSFTDTLEETHFLNALPVRTVDGLLALDEILRDKSKETELVNFLARLCGSNVGDSCRRALRASLLDEVACEFSWAGQKGKRVFSALNLKTAIFRAVLAQFKDATEKDMENIVKDWLRPSRNRLLSKEKFRRRNPGDLQEGDNT